MRSICEADSDTKATPVAPCPPPASAALTPRPGRSLAWVVRQTFQRTWYVVLIHAGAAGVLFAETTWLDWLLLPLVLYVRGVTTTVGLHRYFAHRSFKTGRAAQFLLACLCCCNIQRGPLFWAAIHRQHHRHSDGPGDVHSPVGRGFLWAYGGWMFYSPEQPDWTSVRDLSRYPELAWLERLWLVPGLLAAGLCYVIGGWGTVCLGFCLTAVAALHGASLVNSLGHMVGSRRYDTPDRSRNSLLLALLTFGDGWHNNHHHYPYAAQAGFFRGEVDGSFRLILLLERVGLVWGVRRVPPHKLHPPQPLREAEAHGA